MEWAGADQDTLRLALVAWANLGGDNPSGAMKTEREDGERKTGGRGDEGRIEVVKRRWRDGMRTVEVKQQTSKKERK